MLSLNPVQHSLENEKKVRTKSLKPAILVPKIPEFGLLQILLPATPGLVLYKFYDGINRLWLSAASVQEQAKCPACQTTFTAVHSYYTQPADRSTLVGQGQRFQLAGTAFLLLQS